MKTPLMRKMIPITVACFASVFAAACAQTKTEKKVDRELATMEPIESRRELDREVGREISDANIPTAQKSELFALRNRTRGQMDAIHAESLKLRALLVEGMLKTPYDPKVVDVLKKRIEDNEKLKVAAVFRSIDDGNRILGRHPVDEQRRRMILSDIVREHPRGNIEPKAAE